MDKQDLIKFHCAECNKKIGVPEAYAGKYVKCPQCGSAVQVPFNDPEPEPLIELESVSAPRNETVPQDLTGQEPAPVDVWSDDLFNTTSAKPGGDDEPAEESATEGTIHSSAPVPTAYSEAGSTAVAVAKSTIRLPFILAAGFGGAMISAAVWAGIAYATEMELGIVAWGLGAVVGFCVSIFAGRQSNMLGVVAVVFALLGILLAKVFIAQWCIMPQIDKYDFEGIKPTSDIIQTFTTDADKMFAVAALEYAQAKGAPDGFAWLLVKARSMMQSESGLGGNNDSTGAESSVVNDNDPAKNKSANDNQDDVAIKGAIKEVTALRDSWSRKEKVVMVRKHFPSIMRRVQILMHGEEGFFMAFKSLFSLFDILWVILAAGTAFKIASGRATA